jgi:ankyrin repeat protein
LAAAEDHEAVVELLLVTDKVEIDPKGRVGRTPLSQPVLTAGRVNIDEKDRYKQAALSWAAARRRNVMVQLLQTHQAGDTLRESFSDPCVFYVLNLMRNGAWGDCIIYSFLNLLLLGIS